MHAMDISSLAIFLDFRIKDHNLPLGPTKYLGEESSSETFNTFDELKSSKGSNLFLY